MDLTISDIQERIAALVKQRSDLVTEVNMQISGLNGAIAAYNEVLSVLEEVKGEHVPEIDDGMAVECHPNKK